ncbi:hypothetical protein ABC502_10040 [Alkalimonas sp. NCh-2]|uniref:hypothetical protein n=1 Tax=Alkalimonas sp. NCh-2 TaxID=3144846 RepID=UPI0031F63A2D
MPKTKLFTATIDEMKIAQKSLRGFEYSTFTKYPFLNANICMTRSATITTNTKNCAFKNEKLSIYSTLPKKLTPPAGAGKARSVLTVPLAGFVMPCIKEQDLLH